MPELPEVETTVRGISPEILGRTVTDVIVRESRLRWPVPDALRNHVVGNVVSAAYRRAKYILINVGEGHVLIHLGMSGSLRIAASDEPPQTHDHIDIEIDIERRLRLRDPRKFGCVLWIPGDVSQFPLLARLGCEPLSDEFGGNYLYPRSRNRKTAVKNFIMDSRVVVGIGNIYASEALFRAGIHPARRAQRISRQRYNNLAFCIKATLSDALLAGGTTLRDFVNGTGEPGYFSQKLSVYDRDGLACPNCSTPISRLVIGQRSTYYCKTCQH